MIGGDNGFMKILLLIALLALAGLFLLVAGWSTEMPPPPGTMPVGQPAADFRVRVTVPRLGLPLFGILPDQIVNWMECTTRELGFDQSSPGAQVTLAAPGKVELRDAAGWILRLETGPDGGLAPASRLTFPLAIGGRHTVLSCGRKPGADGFLLTTTEGAEGEARLRGSFIALLEDCDDLGEGKKSGWPPAALMVRGSFDAPLAAARP